MSELDIIIREILEIVPDFDPKSKYDYRKVETILLLYLRFNNSVNAVSDKKIEPHSNGGIFNE